MAGAAQPQADRRRWLGWSLKPSVLARIAVGVTVVALSVWYGGERLIHRVSLEGVVNSPLLLLRAPIDGRVVKSLARPGLSLSAPTELLEIEDPRIDTRLSTELAAQRARLAAQIAALDERTTALTTLRDQLTSRVEEHRAATTERLQHSVNELKASLEAANSALSRASEDDKRVAKLAPDRLASQQRIDEAHDTLRRAQADVARVTAELARTRSELDAAQRGILIGEGYGDVPYSQQRIDEIRLTLAELAQQRGVLVADLAETETRAAAESHRLEQVTSSRLSAPSGAVVLSANVREGSEVVRGDILAELVDCSRAYIEAALPERGFDKVRPGSAATVTLRGNGATLHAIVRALQGAGAVQAPRDFAALLERPTSDAMTVILDVNPAEFKEFSGGRCQVGRQATVVFAE